jgi:hypothetical protein
MVRFGSLVGTASGQVSRSISLRYSGVPPWVGVIQGVEPRRRKS